jgi:protein-S-isoprenylcysteine O-methyltransferase Ste14
LRGVTRWLRAWNVVVFAAWMVVPFAAAGLRWTRGWLHVTALGVAVAVHGRYVRRRNPTLRARRGGIREGTEGWDLAWNAVVWPLFASIAGVAALEARGGASPSSPWTWPLGAALLAAGFGLSASAMATNPFFEGVVRIQREVGHRTVEDGPYHRVRHPGYAGLALWALSTPLLLGSSWALVPALATAAWVILRTALEDAVLRRELPGYADYARRVRWRLAPRVW